jgi:1-deoxy-D-xylulose-5-phosphate synthase
LFDLSFVRQIPGMTVMAPRDENELRDMLKFAADYTSGPISIRYPRGSGTAKSLRTTFRKIPFGKAELLREGDAAVLLAVGEMVPPAIKAADILEAEGIRATVANMRFIRPLDTGLLDTLAESGMPLVTLEENILAGGFGSAVSEYYLARGKHPELIRIGLPDEFAGQASRTRLLELYGLDALSIAEKVRMLVHD